MPTSRDFPIRGNAGDLSLTEQLQSRVSPGQGRQPYAQEWSSFDRRKAQSEVNKLQRRIYGLTQKGEFHKVVKTQKLLVKSASARYLAVRRVTSNKGKLTAGVDGKVVVSNDDKWALMEALKDLKAYKAEPTRTVYIPKKDGSKRKLGIPTIKDRAMQALILIALDPEWEAKFEPHSFGFRPGRSAIDAVQYIGRTFVPKRGKKPHPGWVLDADMSNCFDNINHDALLNKLMGFPFKGTIHKWLKAGSVSQIGFDKTERGTPQGGVISPLLANIALDGMERLFGIYSKNGKYLSPNSRGKQNKGISLYRYADDFIVMAPSKEVLKEYVLPKVSEFLTGIGISLNKAKTRIVNISEGFNFLGFHFRRFKRRDGRVKEFVYTPVRSRLDKFLRDLKIWLRTCYSRPVKEIIAGLNRRIRGFCNYFRWSNAHRAFAYLNHRIYYLLWSWANHRHQRKRGARWIKYRYWRPIKGSTSQWVFHFKGAMMVQPYNLTVRWWKRPVVRIHTSPYDPASLDYWKNRLKRHKWATYGLS